jgi:pimeloyl-ACP methyl ester carboxylesterase
MTGAVVCLHGLGRTPADWDGVRAGLGRFGDVRAPALPARQRDAVALLAPMIAAGDIVVGHSMGGVAWPQFGGRAGSIPRTRADRLLLPARPQRTRLGQSLADYAAHRVAYVRAVAGARGARRQRAPRIDARARAARPAGAARAGGPCLARARRHADARPLHASRRPPRPGRLRLGRQAAAHPAWRCAILPSGGHHTHVEHPDEWLAVVSPWL